MPGDGAVGGRGARGGVGSGSLAVLKISDAGVLTVAGSPSSLPGGSEIGGSSGGAGTEGSAGTPANSYVGTKRMNT